MKIYFYMVCMAVAFSSCGQPSASGNENTDAPEKTAAGPKLVINEADWVDTDLSGISNLTPISVKLPKDAKLEKNGNGGVDATINDFYVISIGQPYASNLKELIEGNKSLTIGRTSAYKNIKLFVDEPNGFVFTFQMQDEANGFQYEPEAHFYYAIETEGGAHFSFQDSHSTFSVPGSSYPVENAKKVYEIIKKSAKVLE